MRWLTNGLPNTHTNTMQIALRFDKDLCRHDFRTTGRSHTCVCVSASLENRLQSTRRRESKLGHVPQVPCLLGCSELMSSFRLENTALFNVRPALSHIPHGTSVCVLAWPSASHELSLLPKSGSFPPLSLAGLLSGSGARIIWASVLCHTRSPTHGTR